MGSVFGDGFGAYFKHIAPVCTGRHLEYSPEYSVNRVYTHTMTYLVNPRREKGKVS